MTDLCALTAALPGHFLSNPGTTVLTSNHSVVQQTPVPVQILSSGQVVQPQLNHHQQQVNLYIAILYRSSTQTSKSENVLIYH